MTDQEAVTGAGSRIVVRAPTGFAAFRQEIEYHPERLPGKIVFFQYEWGEWTAVYFGVLLASGGPPTPRHAPGALVVFKPERLGGVEYWLLSWVGGDPIVIQVWELEAKKAEAPAKLRMSWRPGWLVPKWAPIGLELVPRLARQKLVREMERFTDQPSKAGRKPQDKAPDKQFEKSLEEALISLIPFYRRTLKREDILTALNGMKPNKYYRKLEQSGWTAAQIQAWIDAVVVDWEEDGSEQWRPRKRLQRLPRNF